MSDATKRVAPYGAWPSPIAISRLTDGVVFLAEAGARDGRRWWIEGRPDEGGRQVLVVREPDGSTVRWTPEGFNARTRVHEYGGGATLVDGDVALVSDFVSGRLHRVAAPGVLAPLTPERAWRFADGVLDRARARALYVREDHEPATLSRHGEAEQSIVSVDLATGDVSVVVAGADFYAAPRLSPDGATLCWLEWRHPNMPWDGTELRIAPVAPDGTLGEPRTIAGSASDWISEPRWSPDGVLHFVAEPTGWMNLHRYVGGSDASAPGRVEAVVAMDAEVALPDWQFGFIRYAFLPDGGIAFAARSGGHDRLYRIGPGHDPTVAPELVDVPWTEIPSVAADGWTLVARAASPTEPTAILELDLTTGERRSLAAATHSPIAPSDVSFPRPIEFATAGGRTAFGLFYAPLNKDWRGPDGTLPPLIVTSHGGPTSQAWSAYQTGPQLFTSRGFAVLDVDYGGSTGYGRDYRKRLEGRWGVVDVEDCVAGARWLTEQGLVDGDRLAIRGGSASGYTTLCAITFTDRFDAGVSMFGLGDLETFVHQTHKFESRYLERLVGPYPAAKQLYHDRSPLNFADRISCPVLVLQGLEDRVVPPAQAEQIVDALWERRVPHAYVPFAGEDHGFRSHDAVIRSFEVELSFYAQVFGFEPADRIEPVEIAFLDRRPG